MRQGNITRHVKFVSRIARGSDAVPMGLIILLKHLTQGLRALGYGYVVPSGLGAARSLSGDQSIEHTDSEIDRLVYELYGLSEEEIKVVEGAN